MDVLFLGVGECCDPLHPNTALLLRSTPAGKGSLLLDCGFTVPHLFFALELPADEPAALWISHFHGDHFLGTPLLLLRLWEMGRRSPLEIAGPVGVRGKVEAATELAYPGFLQKLCFPLFFTELAPGLCRQVAGLELRCAASLHSQSALAVRIDANGKSLYYSGDGRPTEAGVALARGCGLVVHEAFRVTGETVNHGSVEGCLTFAAAASVSVLALVHLQRRERLDSGEVLHNLAAAHPGIKVLVPRSGDSFSL